RFLFLPAEHDPDSYVREFGVDAFRDQAKNAAALSRFMLEELASRHNLDEAEGRAACVHEAIPLLQALPDCTLSLQIEQEFAQMVRLTPDELQLRLMQAQAAAKPAHSSQESSRVQSVPAEDAHYPQAEPWGDMETIP